MDTTLKGALAAGAAAVLLIGGAGTLAYWDDSETVDGTTISSGELKLGAPVCGAWRLNDAADFTTQLVVPGDQLTRSCTVDLIATGANIQADLALSDATFATTDNLTGELDASAAFTVGGASVTTVDAADDTGTDEIGVEITVDFDFATATNASQDVLNTALQDLTLTLTQTDATP